jgi:hypothetical protein
MKSTKNKSSEIIVSDETHSNAVEVSAELSTKTNNPMGRDDDQKAQSLDEFGKEIYIDKVLAPKEVFKAEIPFSRDEFDSPLFRWEYICRTEQTPSFAIYFIPSLPEQSSIIEKLPYHGTSARILFPLSHIQCYSRPAYGAISLSGLPSGKIILCWENNLPLSSRSPKSITYKTTIHNSASTSEAHGQVAIPRKSFFSLPIVYSNLQEGQKIRIDYSTGNVHVPFALYFDEFDESQSISARLVKAASSEDLGTSANKRKQRKTLISFNHASGGNGDLKVSHFVPIEASGVFTLVWDNSSSMVSTRQVIFNTSIE